LYQVSEICLCWARGKERKPKKLDEERKVFCDFELVAGDRDGEIDADPRPKLNPHSIWRGAVDDTDAQALLHPAE
jgi:hypothetical protein